ncbi:MAG: DUF898 family protein [Deltaproteobacteria bacterium]|jgi:uncharacterized membrane protein YjgN (DUF898 family)|nr:DUF898 family protein [Deltaproteobacteria bacterium]
MAKGNCQFEGTGGQYFSAMIFHLGLFSIATLGLYLPWALVRLFKLKASHTTIQGKKTTFTGTGGALFVRLLLNGLLTFITIGFYGPWALCQIFRWKAGHTLVEGTPSRFTGTGGSLFVLYLFHLILLPMVTFGFYCLVGMYRFHAWKEEHTLYGGKPTSFGAGLGEYVKICLLTWVLNSITFALFTPWSLCMLYRWQMGGLAVGDKDLVDHFPPAHTNWRAVLITFLMGLLLFAAAGFFIMEEIKFHIQAFSQGSFNETGVLKSRIVRNRPEVLPSSSVPEVGKKVGKSTPVSQVDIIKTALKPVAPEKIQSKKPQPDNRDFENDLKKLDLFIKENPKNGDAFYNRACLYVSKGDLNRALKDYTEAIRINSENVDAYCNRGNTYYDLGKYDLAIQDYAKALKIDPRDGDVYFNRGLAHLALEQKDQALSDFKEALQLGQKQAGGYLKRGKDL